MVIDKRFTASAAATVAVLVAGLLQAVASPAPAMVPASESQACSRDIEGVTWFFDPCVPEGSELPPDVLTGLEEDRRARECASSPTPVPSATATADARRAARVGPTQLETPLPPTAEPTLIDPTQSAEPTQSVSPTQSAGPTQSASPTPSPSPCPSPTTPVPTPSDPEPSPSEPEPTPERTRTHAKRTRTHAKRTRTHPKRTRTHAERT